MNWKRIATAGIVAGMVTLTGCATNLPETNQGNRNGQRVTDAVNRRPDTYRTTSGRLAVTENQNMYRANNNRNNSANGSARGNTGATTRGMRRYTHGTHTNRRYLNFGRPGARIGNTFRYGNHYRRQPHGLSSHGYDMGVNTPGQANHQIYNQANTQANNQIYNQVNNQTQTNAGRQRVTRSAVTTPPGATPNNSSNTRAATIPPAATPKPIDTKRHEKKAAHKPDRKTTRSAKPAATPAKNHTAKPSRSSKPGPAPATNTGAANPRSKAPLGTPHLTAPEFGFNHRNLVMRNARGSHNTTNRSAGQYRHYGTSRKAATRVSRQSGLNASAHKFSTNNQVRSSQVRNNQARNRQAGNSQNMYRAGRQNPAPRIEQTVPVVNTDYNDTSHDIAFFRKKTEEPTAPTNPTPDNLPPHAVPMPAPNRLRQSHDDREFNSGSQKNHDKSVMTQGNTNPGAPTQTPAPPTQKLPTRQMSRPIPQRAMK